jgi:hypothetical protein
MATHAAGIEYSRVPGFDQDLFRCTPWRATLSIPACAKRWTEAQTARQERGEELRLCRQCPTGAIHAGKPFIHRSTVFANNTCPRCRRGTSRRMVGNRVCIGCYNRHREVLKGRNGKGTAPLKTTASLHLIRIGVRIDLGSPEERTVEFADIGTGAAELQYHVERTHEGEIAFCDPGEPGTYPAWAPAPVAPNSVLAAVVATSNAIARESRRAATAEARETCGGQANQVRGGFPHRTPSSPLRRAALSSSCFSARLRSMTRRPPAWIIGSCGSTLPPLSHPTMASQ